MTIGGAICTVVSANVSHLSCVTGRATNFGSTSQAAIAVAVRGVFVGQIEQQLEVEVSVTRVG